ACDEMDCIYSHVPSTVKLGSEQDAARQGCGSDGMCMLIAWSCSGTSGAVPICLCSSCSKGEADQQHSQPVQRNLFQFIDNQCGTDVSHHLQSFCGKLFLNL